MMGLYIDCVGMMRLYIDYVRHGWTLYIFCDMVGLYINSVAWRASISILWHGETLYRFLWLGGTLYILCASIVGLFIDYMPAWWDSNYVPA